MFDWNDLRYLLAIDANGSTIAAAKAMQVNQSTVQRRIKALEQALGVSLAVRDAAGYHLTDAAQRLMPAARQVDAAIEAFAGLADKAAQLEQRVLRVTCPEPIVPRLLPLLDAFELAHPSLRVEVVTSDRYVDLRGGDADVAFRSGDTDADLVGRKVARSSWAVYASTGYVERHGRLARIEDLEGHPLIGFDTAMAPHRVTAWLGEIAPDARMAARASSVLGLIQAVRAGIGIAPLPANIADADPGLVRLFGPVIALEREWRLLTSRELRRTPRVAAFYAFIAAQAGQVRRVLG